VENIRTYRDLQAWIQAQGLTVRIYSVTTKFPKEEVYGLTAQMRRAAVSVPSNIAEGCGRGTSPATIAFLFISRGSLYEIETQCLIASTLGYLPKEELQDILKHIESCKKLINGLIRYFESKGTPSV
jgi:four helix bundle protein